MKPSRSPRDAAVMIVRTLQAAGHVAYLAGGCVRDQLLGREPKDYDVATDAHPLQVRALFRQTQFVGEAFGVVLVKLGGGAIEVATFRTEWGYQDGRRPDGVQFCDAQRDAQRRDFTINGLFYDPLSEQIIDYVAGQADLQAKVIRAIGDPDQRFAEDYLRMLRAVRFAARLDFTIETRTARAIANHARYLGQISRERIGQEVLAMAQLPRFAAALEQIEHLRLDGPTLNEEHQESDPAPLRTLAELHDAGPDVALVLATWLAQRHGLPAAPRTLTGWRRALSLSNQVRDDLRDTLTAAQDARAWERLTVAQRKRLLARPRWASARLLVRALSGQPEFARLEAALQQDVPALQASGVAPLPLVSGDDLLALGMTPGRRVGQLLYAAYDAQLEGRLTDRASALRWLQAHSAGQNEPEA